MKKPVLSTGGFDKLLATAIDESFSSLGEPSKVALYNYLEASWKLKKWEIPRQINSFEAALEKIFGVGAQSLENLIMKRLQAKIQPTCIVVELPVYLDTLATYNRLKK